MKSLIEVTAKQVYQSMRIARTNPSPEWVEGGNSIMQDEARRSAKAILAEVFAGGAAHASWGYSRTLERRTKTMFSVRQKREIADAVQRILRATNHPELPTGEIQFHLHVDGAESWSWADIKNNEAVLQESVNPWNEQQDPTTPTES